MRPLVSGRSAAARACPAPHRSPMQVLTDIGLRAGEGNAPANAADIGRCGKGCNRRHGGQERAAGPTPGDPTAACLPAGLPAALPAALPPPVIPSWGKQPILEHHRPAEYSC
ncbi:hypothetical protein RC1_2857 [Rhodospirillum centenum SW]|uniref:Uncharacterized protein n=1 Tax=Rhodospirillum centenum (strain ATCC 51521 / SW) TaxID=414684 RepID=B6IVA3_RHOCS|nr:hypothetical protein RC1_2857 [Rhodospirillum centenum SW]